MTILPYSPDYRPQLEDLMVAYMTELDCGIPEDIIRTRIFDLIQNHLDAGILRIDLALSDHVPVGFSVYQIDRPDSDWCKRPGWGFIREFYVVPGSRRQGTGRQLASHTEQMLRQWGAGQLYLTSTSASTFWQTCGWTLTQELCSNGQFILEK